MIQDWKYTSSLTGARCPQATTRRRGAGVFHRLGIASVLPGRSRQGYLFARYSSGTVATPRRGGLSRFRIVLEPGIEPVILPNTVDAKILAGKALALESRLLQEPNRGGVRRDA